MPVYYLLLGFMFLIAPRLEGWVHTEGIAGTAPWYLAYLANAHAILRGPTYTALGPTWSLAVEEQFYLVWPLMILLCNGRRLLRVCLALVVLAPIIRIGLLVAGMDLSSIYVLTPARLDGFAMGACLTLLARNKRGLASYAGWGRAALVAGGAGLMAIAFMQGDFRYDTIGMETIGYSFGTLAFGGLLLLSLVPGRVSGWLRAPVLRSFGRYSYAIYLAHVPILEVVYRLLWGTDIWYRGSERLLFGSPLASQIVLFSIVTAASYATGWLSWQLIERHVLGLKRFVAYPIPSGEQPTQRAGQAAAVLSTKPTAIS